MLVRKGFAFTYDSLRVRFSTGMAGLSKRFSIVFKIVGIFVYREIKVCSIYCEGAQLVKQ